MRTIVHTRVEQARSGTNPTVIARMSSGWAVLGDQQFLPGYALLLPDPVVASLNYLQGESRVQFLSDMAKLGDALLQVTGAERINYAIYGNHDPALHAHLFPRYGWEPEAYRLGPVWQYPKEQWESVPFDSMRHQALLIEIEGMLKQGDH